MWSVSRSAPVSAAEAVPRGDGGEGDEEGGEAEGVAALHAPPSDSRAKSCVSPLPFAADDVRPRAAPLPLRRRRRRRGRGRRGRRAALRARRAAGSSSATRRRWRAARAGKVTLVASFERHEDARAAIAELPAAWAPRLEEVVGDAWRDEWKKHFEPFRVCAGVVVRPPWRRGRGRPGEHVVVLEPGRAFGTGPARDDEPRRRGRSRTRPSRARRCSTWAAAAASSRSSRWRSGRRARGRSTSIPTRSPSRARTPSATALADRVEADETPVEAVAERYPVVLANIEAKTLVELAPALDRARRAGRPPRAERRSSRPRSPRRSSRTSAAPSPR